MKNCCFFLFIVLVCETTLRAQIINPSDSAAVPVAHRESDSINRQKDLIDIAYYLIPLRILEHKADSVKAKPNKLYFAGWPATGYSLQTGLTALLTLNISFYKGDPDHTNLSSVIMAPEYSLFKHQLLLPLVFDVWTKNNAYNFQGDWRYYKYPTPTFGLGGHSDQGVSDLIDYSYYRIYQQVLKHLSGDFYGGIGYALDYHTGITSTTNFTHFRDYGDTTSSTTSSGFFLTFEYDTRRNINNPQGGMYAQLIFRPNLVAMGSDRNWQSLQLDFRKYIRFPASSRNILAFWSYDWLTFGKAPYLDLPSTSWDTYSNLGRGYTQGRFRGPNLLYLETEYRISLTRNGLLGMVAFANAQSVSEYPSNRFETLQPAAGLGLRAKINKFSNANFAFDYAVGTGGSRGVFINICEVF